MVPIADLTAHLADTDPAIRLFSRQIADILSAS